LDKSFLLSSLPGIQSQISLISLTEEFNTTVTQMRTRPCSPTRPLDLRHAQNTGSCTNHFRHHEKKPPAFLRRWFKPTGKTKLRYRRLSRACKETAVSYYKAQTFRWAKWCAECHSNRSDSNLQGPSCSSRSEITPSYLNSATKRDTTSLLCEYPQVILTQNTDQSWVRKGREVNSRCKIQSSWRPYL